MRDFIGGSCNTALLDVLACEQPQYIYRHLTALKRLWFLLLITSSRVQPQTLQNHHPYLGLKKNLSVY